MATSDAHSSIDSFEDEVTQIKSEIEAQFRQLTEYLKNRREKLERFRRNSKQLQT